MVTNELIERISTKQVVTTDEMVETVSEITGTVQENGYVYKKFIYPLLKRKYLNRIRRNLYQVTTPGNRDNVADRFIIASMVRDDYYIGLHAALEFFGVAYSFRNHAHICVNPRDRFDVFKYQNTIYTPFLTEDTKTCVTTHMYSGRELKVCSKERLFIECIRYPAKVGGWEEILKSLQGLGGIDFVLLLDYLLKTNNQSLIRRTGLVLELFKENSLFYEHLEEKILRKVENQVEGNVRYFMKGSKGDLNERWMLYVPPDFEQYLRAI